MIRLLAFIVALTIGGVGLVIAAVYLLSGLAWALLASGAACIATAAFLMIGLRANV